MLPSGVTVGFAGFGFQVIDPVVPRFTALSKDAARQPVPVYVQGAKVESKPAQKHPKVAFTHSKEKPGAHCACLAELRPQ